MKGLGFQRLVEIQPENPQAAPCLRPGQGEKPGKGASFERTGDFEPQVLPAAADDPVLAVLFQAPAVQRLCPAQIKYGSAPLGLRANPRTWS